MYELILLNITVFPVGCTVLQPNLYMSLTEMNEGRMVAVWSKIAWKEVTQRHWFTPLLRGRHLPTSLRSTAFQALFTKLWHQMILQAYPASAGWLGRLKLVAEPIVMPWEGRARVCRKDRGGCTIC